MRQVAASAAKIGASALVRDTARRSGSSRPLKRIEALGSRRGLRR